MYPCRRCGILSLGNIYQNIQQQNNSSPKVIECNIGGITLRNKLVTPIHLLILLICTVFLSEMWLTIFIYIWCFKLLYI